MATKIPLKSLIGDASKYRQKRQWKASKLRKKKKVEITNSNRADERDPTTAVPDGYYPGVYRLMCSIRDNQDPNIIESKHQICGELMRYIHTDWDGAELIPICEHLINWFGSGDDEMKCNVLGVFFAAAYGNQKSGIYTQCMPFLYAYLNVCDQSYVTEVTLKLLGQFTSDKDICRKMVNDYAMFDCMSMLCKKWPNIPEIHKSVTFALWGLSYADPTNRAMAEACMWLKLRCPFVSNDEEIKWILCIIGNSMHHFTVDMMKIMFCEQFMEFLIDWFAVKHNVVTQIVDIFDHLIVNQSDMLNALYQSILINQKIFDVLRGSVSIHKMNCPVIERIVWFISNLCTVQESVHQMLQTDLILGIFSLFWGNYINYETKTISVMIICDAIISAGSESLKMLVDEGCIKIMADYLLYSARSNEPNTINHVFAAAKRIIDFDINYLEPMESDGMRMAIERFADAKNERVATVCVYLLDTYFDQHDRDDYDGANLNEFFK